MNRVETTVFELAGPDRPGLLAEVTHLLTHNGCNIRSAAVRTGKGRAGSRTVVAWHVSELPQAQSVVLAGQMVSPAAAAIRCPI